MAKLTYTKPQKKSHYKHYKAWLLENQQWSCCGYCFISYRTGQIDHYEPQSYKPLRSNDPDNLIWSCDECNSNRMKGDYHPSHTKRNHHKQATHGFYIHNVRKEDVSRLFKLTKTGEITHVGSTDVDRAIWLMGVFYLHYPTLTSIREKILKGIEALRGYDQVLDGAIPLNQEQKDELLKLISFIDSHSVYLKAFDLAYPKTVKSKISSAPLSI